MRLIAKLVDNIDEELESAQEYAERYIYEKSRGNSSLAGRYRDMAAQELEHALVIHNQAVEEIDRIKEVYKAPAEMEKKWEESHKEYVDKMARIKTMIQ